MKVKNGQWCFLLILAGLPGLRSDAIAGRWGFYAHRMINRHAVYTLPPEMSGFYKKHLDVITERSVAPDRRRYVIPEEGPRHYFDTEAYLRLDTSLLYESWDKAVSRYSKDTLLQHGILIWHIEKITAYLTAAFKAGDSASILRHSADLGHYVADAHVPLHATENYNGQLTGQTGIHAFWESRIPELFAENYNFLVGRAKYINDIPATIRQVVFGSYLASDSVLKLEARLSNSFPSDKKYTVTFRNKQPVNTYSVPFSRAYRDALDHMIENRMRQAVLMSGSFWYTAWVNAGQPHLVQLNSGGQTEKNGKQQTPEDKK